MATTKGVDFSWARPDLECLHGKGMRFAGRYVLSSSGKSLTRPEADKLAAAGMSIVSIHQPDKDKGWMLGGYDRGVRAARDAVRVATACGMPQDRPITYPLDIDPNPLTAAQWARVKKTLEGIHSVHGKGRTVIYGGWKAVDVLVPSHAVYGYQTSSYSGGRWHPDARLRQYNHDRELCGGQIDYVDAVAADYGQWRPGWSPTTAGGGAKMQLVTRAQWGARPPKNRTSLNRHEQKGTAVHYTASDADETSDHAKCAGRVKGIQRFHMDGRGWSDIAYSRLACKHGFVFEGRGPGIRTAANGTNAGNDAYHAVCFMGDDTAGRDDVTDPGRLAIRQAVLSLNTWAGVDDVKPHSAFKSTACPGNDLRAWIAKGMPVADAGLKPEGGDELTDAEMKELKNHITLMAEHTARRTVHAILTGGQGQWANDTRKGWEWYRTAKLWANRHLMAAVKGLEPEPEPPPAEPAPPAPEEPPA